MNTKKGLIQNNSRRFCVLFITLILSSFGVVWGETLELSAKLENQSLSLKLGVDLSQNQVLLYPLPKNETGSSLTLRSGSGLVFEGRINWISVADRQFFAPDKTPQGGRVASTTQTLVTNPVKTASDPKGVLLDSGVSLNVDSVVLAQLQAGTSVGEPLFNLPSTNLTFSALKAKNLIVSAVDTKGVQQVVVVKIQDFTYWVHALDFWGNSSSDTQTIKNTLFRALLTDDMLAFLDFPYDQPKYAALIANLAKSRKDFLDDFARLVYSQLGVTNGSDYESTRLPGSALYESDVTADSAVAKQYFQVLQNSQRNTSTFLSQDIRDKMVRGVLHYLFGPESTLNSIKTLDDKVVKLRDLNNLYGALTPSFFSNTTLAQESSNVSGAELTVFQNDAQTPVLLDGAASELIFLPNAPNVLKAGSLQSAASVSAILWETTDTRENPLSTINFAYNGAQEIAYWAFWANDAFAVNTINGVRPTSVSRLRKASNSSGEYKLETNPSSVGGVDQLYILSFPLSKKVNWTIDLAPGSKVIKMAAYAGNPLTSYSWKREKNTFRLAGTTGARFSDVQIILSKPTSVVSFLSVGYQKIPLGGGSTDAFSPVRYAYGGWETPQSYNSKVLDNRLAKASGSTSTSRFPFTEFDALKVSRLTNSSGLYESAPVLSDFRAPYGLAASPSPYVYSYGLNLPYQVSTLENPQSPFFVEKLAGVDSLGLLSSLLLSNGISPTYDLVDPAEVAKRWTHRTGVLAFPDFFPFKQSASEKQSLTSLTKATVRWYELNSNVLTDWTAIQPGDILVGTEGTGVESAVVVWIPSNPGDFKTLMAQTRVVAINKPLQAAVLTTWNQLPNALGYHARRLVASRNPNRILFAPLHNTIAQGQNTYVAATGEMSEINTLAVIRRGSSFADPLPPSIAVRPAIDSQTQTLPGWSLPAGSVVDYDYQSGSNGSTGANNTLTNPTDFYLIAYASNYYESRIRGDWTYGTDQEKRFYDTSMLNDSENYPEAVTLAKFSPQPGQAEMKIEWQFNAEKYKLVTIRDGGKIVLGVSGAVLDRKETVFRSFGILARARDGGMAHVGDDIQISFSIGPAVVYRTMPISVISLDPNDYWDYYEKAASNLEALDATIDLDQATDASEKRTRHFYVEYWRALLDRDDVYDSRLEDDRVVAAVINAQKRQGLEPQAAAGLVNDLDQYLTTGHAPPELTDLAVSVDQALMSGLEIVELLTSGMPTAGPQTSKYMRQAVVPARVLTKSATQLASASWIRGIITNVSNFASLKAADKLLFVRTAWKMTFKDMGWGYLRVRRFFEDVLGKYHYTGVKGYTQTQAVESLNGKKSEYFELLDFLKGANINKATKSIEIASEAVSLKTTVVTLFEKFLTTKMATHLAALQRFASGQSYLTLGYQVRLTGGKAVLDIRLPKSVLDGHPNLAKEWIDKLKTLYNKVEVRIGTIEETLP